MEVVAITVSQLKCACVDPEWKQRWLAGRNPSTRHCAPPGTEAVGGVLFHEIVDKFAGWLATDAQGLPLADENALWAQLYSRFAEAGLEHLAAEGRVGTAVHLSGALRAFCARIAALRCDTPGFVRWSDIFLAQEHRVKDVRFALGERSVFVSGVVDSLRLRPGRGFEVVDYKLSRGANLRHDLMQLAIYARLLAETKPGMRPFASLEYYLPELELLEVSQADLDGIFEDLVMPVLRELAGVEASQTSPPPGDAGANAAKIAACFRSFALPVVVTGCVEGPQLLRYTVQPASGVKVVSLANRAEDLQVALNLAQAPRIEPSAAGVTIDIPRPKPETVFWRDVMQRCPAEPVTFPLGVAVDNTVLSADLSEASTCHALVAGSSGSGKSEWLKSVVASLMKQSSPATLRLALIDPKLLTFASLEGSSHLLGPLMTDIGAALAFLAEAVVEMEHRYAVLAKDRHPNLRERHAAGKRELPYWVIVFDEFADLILAGKEEKKAFENAVSRLAGKGRAAGIHLILATQRPDRNIVTGLIKANLPLKVCLRVTSAINSQIVLDEPGAEKLLGRGDLLCDFGRGVQRAQSPLVTAEDFGKLLK